MMPVIKKMIMSMKQINREYILLFIIVGLLVCLIYSSTAVSQLQPQEIALTTFYPSPFGEFSNLQATIFRDFDDPMNFFCDPSGTSVFQTLEVRGAGIRTPYIAGPLDTFFINFTTGDAELNNVKAFRFFQEDPGPHGTNAQRGGGKHVYDIAEGILALDCQAGDVVLISQDEDMKVVKSTTRFDSRVAGVISEEPKIYMGASNDKLPLALAGVVKCKATTENGQIKRGDLLVSSSLPGHAMRAAANEIKPGMLIGKALEPLKEKTGKIFILVNKQ